MGDCVREPLSETALLGVWDGVCGPAREYVLRWLERQDLTIGLANPPFFVPQLL